jgi:TolA-binding protein
MAQQSNFLSLLGPQANTTSAPTHVLQVRIKELERMCLAYQRAQANDMNVQKTLTKQMAQANAHVNALQQNNKELNNFIDWQEQQVEFYKEQALKHKKKLMKYIAENNIVDQQSCCICFDSDASPECDTCDLYFCEEHIPDTSCGSCLEHEKNIRRDTLRLMGMPEPESPLPDYPFDDSDL